MVGTHGDRPARHRRSALQGLAGRRVDDRNRPEEHTVNEEKVCQRCGCKFGKPSGIDSRAWANRKFCSRSCYNFPLPPSRECPTCGTSFTPSYKFRMQKYCGHSCAMKDNHAVQAASHTKEAIAKRSDTRRGSGNGLSYIKRDGRHEHRTIAEQKIGRPLLPGEIVHHDDDDKRNNDPENLIILPSQAEHARLHAKRMKRIPRTVCKKGLHPLEGSNIAIRGGKRICRACWSVYIRHYRAKSRGAQT